MRGRLRLGWAGLALLAAAPGDAAWMEAGSDHFLIYGDVAPAKIAAYANRLERFDQAMRLILKLDGERPAPANRVTIYILANGATVRSLCGGGRQCRHIEGYYFQRASGATAFMPARAGNGGEYDLNADIVMFHEYVHHLVLGSSGFAVPGWLNEGIAEFGSTAKFAQDGGVELGVFAMHRAYDLVAVAQIPVATLLDADRRKLSVEDQAQVYSRGWLLTHYLIFASGRSGQLARYLELLAKGKSSLEAGAGAFGDLKQLDHDLNAYLAQRRWKDFKIAPVALHVGTVAVRPLRPGEAALMPLRIRSVAGVNGTTAGPLAADARARAAPFGDDPWVQGVLAEMEYDAGRDDAAEAAADRALARDPASLQALIYKGKVRLRRAAAAKGSSPATWQEARGWLIKANHVQPDAANPLVLYYDSFGMAGQEPAASAKKALARAAEIVPQDRTVRARLALDLIRDGHLPEARGVLATLAYDPHAEADNPFSKLIAMIDAGGDAKAIAAAAAKSGEDDKPAE